MLQSTPLWYLIQVGNYQSVSIAAEKLHISQPSLSIAIKKLEDELGLKLLERTYRGVCLTEDGKKVVELANKAFSYFDEIESYAKKATESYSDMPKNITIYTNPALIQLLSMAVQHNDTDINIQFHTIDISVDIEQLLREKNDTLVFTILNDSFSPPANIGLTVLSKSKSYILCNSDFAYIPQEKKTISFKELLHVPLILLDHGFEFQDTLLHILSSYGTPTIKATVHDIFSLNAMHSSGFGAIFGNKLTTYIDENSRYVEIRQAPKFITGLLYNKSMPEDIVSTLSACIKPHLI